MTIWTLVEEAARELTENGISPFTRADLIRYVQMKNVSYGPDSINPIIQGLTDNLKGGAPGADGKNILHSIGRGLFVLSDKSQVHLKPPSSRTSSQKPTKGVPKTAYSSKQKTPANPLFEDNMLQVGGYEFRYVCSIEPERGPNGTIITFMPQSEYANTDNLPLNKYGAGPFCRFKIPWNIKHPGVYALVMANDIKYIGECIDLSSRFNSGYGNISPRNCFIRGRETNCRINHLIFKEILAGSKITLWFLNTSNYKSIEAELRVRLLSSWNRV